MVLVGQSDATDVPVRAVNIIKPAEHQTVFDRTSTPDAPWFVVPADRKWYARLAVQALLLDALEEIDPQWPAADFDVAVEKARLAAS